MQIGWNREVGRFGTAAASLAAAIALAAEARAQEPAPSPTPSSESSAPAERRLPARGIDEIVVTARQREERLQDAPVVVTALRREDLDRYGVVRIQDMAQMTPQLFVQQQPVGSGGSLTIRGISSSTLAGGFEQSVSVYLDGLQYSRGYVLSQGYFDLGRVEVLKGPQALFFGKSSNAGVVSITSADPGDELELVGRSGYEFLADEYWGEAIAAGPITEKLAARLALRYDRLEGFVDNLAPATVDPGNGDTVPAPANRRWPGRNEFLGRATIVYRPIDAFEVKLKVAGAKLDSVGASQGIELFSCAALGTSQADPGENCRPDWKIRQNDLPRSIAMTEELFDEEGGKQYSRYDSYSISLPMSYDFGFANLTSITGATHFDTPFLFDADFSATPLITGAQHPSVDSVSEEVRLLSDFDFPVNVMIGGYYQSVEFENRSLSRLPLPQDPATGRYVAWDLRTGSKGAAWSALGQLIWKVVDTVELAPGARYTLETKDSFSVPDYIHPATVGLFRAAGDPVKANFEGSDVSPEVTLTWKPQLLDDADLTLYGAYKRGFKSGGFTNGILMPSTTADQLSYDSETVSGFEGGLKSTWLDGSFLLNVVGYRYEFEDLQVFVLNSTTLATFVQNAASATTTGAEAELRWLPPVDGLDLHGAFSFNVARYGDFVSNCWAGQTRAQGCNLNDDGDPASPVGSGTRQQLAGKIREIAPQLTGALGLLYEVPLPRGLSLALGADASWTDRYFLNPFLRPDVVQDAYFRTDASLRLAGKDGLLEIALVGRNLTDAYFFSAAAIEAPLTGRGTGGSSGLPADQLGAVNRSREIGLQLVARF